MPGTFERLENHRSALVDVDSYQSALDCCSFFGPRHIHCSVMLVDEYVLPSARAESEAIDGWWPVGLRGQFFISGQRTAECGSTSARLGCWQQEISCPNGTSLPPERAWQSDFRPAKGFTGYLPQRKDVIGTIGG